MKSHEQKAEFVRLRAEGKSYAVIAATLHISKSTCAAWELKLKNAIMELKQEHLNELYNSYHMTKEARIKRLGSTLNEINIALEKVDFSCMPPEKLLEYKLRYAKALKEEYTGNEASYHFAVDEIEPKNVVVALWDLLNRLKAREITPEQANRENAVISNLSEAYDMAVFRAEIDAIRSTNCEH